MTKHLTLLLFIGLAWGQDDTGLEVITLKSGDVLKGEIVNASFKSVTLAKANGGEIIKISREDIDNISTPFSRGEVEASIQSNPANTITASTHLYNAGNKLENFVLYTIVGSILNVSGMYLTAQALKSGESPNRGIMLSSAGYVLSFFGFLQVGNAGDDLKRASSMIKSEKSEKSE